MVLIACFGIHAHENDAERAARCAMGIETDLKVRDISSSAGVTTGEVYCGLVGGQTRCEYALIGDDVNMAARLMASTQDEIRCDAKTFAQSNKRVLFEELPPIRVKGKVNKIAVYKPIAGLSFAHHLLHSCIPFFVPPSTFSQLPCLIISLPLCSPQARSLPRFHFESCP